jgi:hypothetical protein
MNQPAARLLLGAVLLSGCSESAEPSPGMFRAQLEGVRVATLSGSSNAAPIFTEEFPEPRFTIRMFASQGDTVRAIVIGCPGEQSPPSGTYAVDPSGSSCVGSYSRSISTPEVGAIVLERMTASSGSVRISESGAGQTSGTFDFSGILVVGSDSLGTLDISGLFSALVL